MSKIIAAINMSLDGFCDHTELIADEEIHDHYTELLAKGGTILYGRITYQLMESYWPALVEKPSGDKALDDFAMSMENIKKLVFSRTLKNVNWESAKLATKGLKEEVEELRKQDGEDIYVGSRSLIIELLNLNLIDEFQICVQPVILGKGLPLFEKIEHRIDFKLLKSKTFKCGAVIFYYNPLI